MTSLKAALFDISARNFAIRASFNRRSWVARFNRQRRHYLNPTALDLITFLLKI